MKRNKPSTNRDFLSEINRKWTLFLDRDGTINQLLKGDYVKTWSEFKFITGVLDAIPMLNQCFDLSIIVTNQQGIGKKLMTEKDLRSIHVEMLNTITFHGGYIDEIYYCPYLTEENSPLRKPAAGMALMAKRDFPEINFKQSVMVGDTLSDMKFGKNLGMKTILLTQYLQTDLIEILPYIDLKYYNLKEFADHLFSGHHNKAH